MNRGGDNLASDARHPQSPVEFSFDTRRENLERMKGTEFDVVVLGGGVTGAGIARDAAARGLKVALLEKGDFGSGTSSRSTRLIHGGLRYLRYFKLGLVYESSKERETLREIAPHLVHPLSFVIPVYEKGPDSMLKIRFGLWLYDILARFRNVRRHRVVNPDKAIEMEPEIRRNALKGAAIYFDSKTDDARLTLLTVISAFRMGAVVANYIEVVDVLKEKERAVGVRVRDKISGRESEVRGKIMVNVTGPWVDDISKMDDPSCQKKLRLTKGIHLMVMREKIENKNAVVMNALKDQRNVFVLPFGSRSLVGTTDTDFEGEPDQVYAEREDVDYLLETVNEYFPGCDLTTEDVISTWAALRPLVDTEAASEYEASREYKITESSSGLITMAGGKLTAHRSMAMKAVDYAVKRLERRHGIRPEKECETDRVPLEGGAIGNFDSYLKEETTRAKDEAGLDEETVAHLVGRYGSNYTKLLDMLKEKPELRQRIVNDLPYIWAELPYAVEHEMAMTLSDFFFRRTRIGYEDWDQGMAISRRVAEVMAKHLGWDSEDVKKHIRAYKREVDEGRRFRRGE
ncbi:MAG: glycerol-3-phosphate dehydrogenase [Aigarchaeota archaeon]|nr:glycerol-3-phosphate dehydrogenase [Aigarchaeota archaeon]